MPPGAKLFHGIDGGIGNSVESTPPASVSSADHARFIVGEQDRRAIGGENPEQQLGPVSDDGVGMRPLLLRPGAVSKNSVGRMDLVHRHQLGARQYGSHRSLAVFEDRGAVVIAAVADVEPSDLTNGHAATPAEEPVRNRAEA